MNFLKIKEKEYFEINVVFFNNWNRVFNRVIHILLTDFGMPNYEVLSKSLHKFLSIVYTPSNYNNVVLFSTQNELELANQMLASALTFLLDVSE